MRVFLACMVCLSMAFAGCDQCYNVDCESPDLDSINGLHFEFHAGDFKYQDVDRAYVLRFIPSEYENPIDTFPLADQIKENDLRFIVPSALFQETDGPLQYELVVYNNSSEYAYSITDIRTEGYYPTDCCCCYRNRERSFELNGEPVERSGTTDAVTLRK